jgi:hypothetical protein
MTTFRRFAVAAALLSATLLAPGLAAADDHGDREDRGRDDRHGRLTPPAAVPRWVERDELPWNGSGRYDGGWEQRSHLLRARAIRHELFELDRERAGFYARNGWRPRLLARYDEAWFARRAELERRLEWLTATARW